MQVRNLKIATAAALLTGSLGAIPAHAEGLYLGGSLGTPRYPDSVNGINGNGSGLSGKLYGGWQVTPNFALEAGAADLGHVDDSSGKVDGRSEFLDAVGTVPLDNKWSLLGRLGVAHVNLDTSGGDASGNGLKLGLGAQYSLSTSTALRGEWERYRPSIFGDKPNIDQYTFGVRVGF
jgi:OmpA-OmpF porin, OOP family